MTYHESLLLDMAVRNNFYKEMTIYTTKVLAWCNKRSTSEIVYEDADLSAYYVEKNLVSLSKDADIETYYHELGHEVFHKFNGDSIIDIEEFLYEAENCYNKNDVEVLLGLYCEQYKLRYTIDRRHPINILSDVLGLMFGSLDHYVSHRDDYCAKATSKTYKNEAFAEMFSTIATKNFDRWCFMYTAFPQFTISCLNLIDCINQSEINKGL